MNKVSFTLHLKTNIEKLFDFHLNPKNLKLLSSPYSNIKIVCSKIPIEKDSFVSIKMFILPFIPIKWDLIIEDVKTNELIVDFQTKGPFKHWRHFHRFETLFDGTVVMTDEIEYELGFGLIGKLFSPILSWFLNRTFKQRHKIIESLFGG